MSAQDSDGAADATFAYLAPLYLAFGSLSLLLAWAMALVYAWNPRVRADHSSTILHFMTMCEGLYALKFVLSAAAWYGGLRDGRASFHLLRDNCATSIAYGQLLGMAAIAYNACWMTDILVVLFLPLRNSATLMPWYHAAVWTLALGTGLLVALGGAGASGDEHTCLLRGDGGLSYTFEGPLLVFVALALVSLGLASWRLQGGGSASQRLRSGVLLRHLAYVAAFIALWLFPIIHSFFDRQGTNFAYNVLDAIAVCSQASATTLIRLSEPAALRTFASTMRRLRNTLAAAVGCRAAGYHQPFGSSGEGGGSGSGSESAAGSEAPLPLYAVFLPCLLSSAQLGQREGGGSSAAEAGAAGAGELLPLHSSREEGEGRAASPAGAPAKWSLWGALGGGSGSGSGSSGGVTASSALLAHAQAFAPSSAGGASGRLAAGGAAEGTGAGKGAGGGYAGAGSPSLSLSSRAGGAGSSSSSSGSGSSGALSSPKSDGSSGDGSWVELSAELRQEMGVAMLTGLVQAVKLAEGHLPSTPSTAASGGSVLLEEEQEGEEGASSEGEGEGLGGGGPAAAPSAAAAPAVPALALAQQRPGPSPSPSPSPSLSLSPRSARRPVRREASHSVVAGPSAPAQRRTIGQLLRDAATVTRRVPTILNLGASGSAISVSALEEGAFRELRRAGGIEAAYLAAQFDPALLAAGKLRSFFSEGASSSFFCRSADDALVVKTVTGSEAEVLLRLLPAYTRHLAQNPGSLLCRFYGAFAVTLPTLARVFFVVMQNVHPVTGAPPPGTSAFTFDLKGSTVNRRARVSKSGGGSGGGGGSSSSSSSSSSGSGSSGSGSSGSGSGSGSGSAAAPAAAAPPPAVKYLWQDMEFRETLPRGIPLVDAGALLAGAGALGGGGGGAAPPPPPPSPSAAAWGGLDADLLAGTERARLLVDQLQRDVTLLASQGIMDYSMLLQIVPIVGGAGAGAGAGEAAGAAQQQQQQHAPSPQHHAISFPPASAGPFSLAEAVRLVQRASNPRVHSSSSGSGAAGAAAGAGSGAGGAGGAGGEGEGARLPEWSALAVSLCALGVPLGAAGAEEAGGGSGAGASGGASGEERRPRPQLPPSAARALVQVGVVDILQYYDTGKRMETAFKQLKYAGLAAVGVGGAEARAGGGNTANISAIDPNLYAVRFMDFAARVFQPQ